MPLPDEAGFDLGAALGVPALTAHRALTVAEDGPPPAPRRARRHDVLAAGGAGAVGHAAIQLARWAGRHRDHHGQRAGEGAAGRAAGAHHAVNYREGDPAAEIRAIAPDGVDIVAEVALGANLDLDLAVLRTRGTIATYANDGGKPVELNVGQNMVLNTRLQFLVLYTAGRRRAPQPPRTSPPRSATAPCRSARSTACHCSASRWPNRRGAPRGRRPVRSAR